MTEKEQFAIDQLDKLAADLKETIDKYSVKFSDDSKVTYYAEGVLDGLRIAVNSINIAQMQLMQNK